MKAIGFTKPSPVLTDSSFSAFDLAMPKLNETDVLVEVQATSINPVDYKQRQKRASESAEPVILGWDAAGIVRDAGSQVVGINTGDKVYYAGDINRQGSNAEYQAVDYRLLAKMPSKLIFTDAASLPLTSLTAFEALFEKLKVPSTQAGKILIIGGAGGVGSIAIELLLALTDAEVYATAGRSNSAEWVKKMGAHHVVNRDSSLISKQLAGELPKFDYIFSTTNSDTYHADFPELLKPGGELCLIDDPKHFDIVPFKLRSQSVHWELMFTKSLFQSKMESQGEILKKISNLVESGMIIPTTNKTFEGLTEANLYQAHSLQESAGTIGKTVIKF